MSQVISLVNQLNHVYYDQNLNDFSILKSIRQTIQSSSTLKDLKMMQAFNDDIYCYIEHEGKSRFNQIKNLINKGEDNFVFSVFSSPYFKSLRLDGFYYRAVDISDRIKEKFHSPALPVNLIETSIGFSSSNVVALFPENHLDNIQLPEDSIFYFMNKFVERFFRTTQPLLKKVKSPHVMSLQNASKEKIEFLASCWVHLHEHFHRQGSMPIPEFLDIKSIKPLAGLEELRVDLLSIIACLEDTELPESQLVAEFILMERLFRYSIESPEKISYDAISSQLLFQYLLENGGISVDAHDIVSIHSDILIHLKKLSSAIATIEKQIDKKDRFTVQSQLLAFVHQYVQYDAENKSFKYHAYFQQLRLLMHV